LTWCWRQVIEVKNIKKLFKSLAHVPSQNSPFLCGGGGISLRLAQPTPPIWHKQIVDEIGSQEATEETTSW
jgi:hypothetical protein